MAGSDLRSFPPDSLIFVFFWKHLQHCRRLPSQESTALRRAHAPLKLVMQRPHADPWSVTAQKRPPGRSFWSFFSLYTPLGILCCNL